MFHTKFLSVALAVAGGISLLATQSRAQIIDPGNVPGTDKYEHWGPTPTGGKVDGGGKVLPADNFVGKTLCFGDGTGGKCPDGHFGKVGRGCDNSDLTGGALLVGTGFARVSKDSVKLKVSDMTVRTTAIFMQARKVVPPVVFGDGLLCIQGAATNLGVKRGNYGLAEYPQFGDLDLCDAGKIPAIGGTVYYQVLYRDETPFNHKNHFNLSNALEVVWVP